LRTDSSIEESVRKEWEETVDSNSKTLPIKPSK